MVVRVRAKGGQGLRNVVAAGLLAILAGCGDAAEAEPPSPEQLADAECEGQAEQWITGFAEDAEGAPTPEAALERTADGAAQPMPAGEPHAIAETADRVEYAFADDAAYTGSATVLRINGTWLTESAEICR